MAKPNPRSVPPDPTGGGPQLQRARELLLGDGRARVDQEDEPTIADRTPLRNETPRAERTKYAARLARWQAAHATADTTWNTPEAIEHRATCWRKDPGT